MLAVPRSATFPRLPEILLIEAEPMLRLTVSSFLERAGYTVTGCADARDAIRLFERRSDPPAVILFSTRWLDDAVAELGHRLRRLAPAAPILCVADAVELETSGGLSLPDGMRVLAHPFDVPDLVGAIRSAIRATARPVTRTRTAHPIGV